MDVKIVHFIVGYQLYIVASAPSTGVYFLCDNEGISFHQVNYTVRQINLKAVWGRISFGTEIKNDKVMKCNKMHILVVCLIQAISISAQSGISGRIIDKNSIPLASATVLLLSHADSTFITGTMSDLDGRFEILHLKSDNYILSFSMMGFKKINMTHQAGQNTMNELGNIVLEEDAYALSDVTVTGKRPPVKIEPGKMTYNLSSALLSTDGNILDALKKLPGVIIQTDGSIILNGKPGATVMMDDKETYLSGENLMNYLRSIPVKSIENIELISQQSAKYDAAGNAGVIHLQKKKMTEQGVNLSMSSGMERGKYNRWNSALSLAVRLNRLNIYVDYSAYWGKDLGVLFASRTYQNAEPPLVIEMDANRQMKYRSQFIKVGIDYDLSEKITIGTYASSNWLNRKKNEVSTSDFCSKSTAISDSTLTALSATQYSYTNAWGGVGLLYKMNEKVKWDASFDYQLFDQGDDQHMVSSFQHMNDLSEKDSLVGNASGEIELYSGQSNVNYALNRKMKLAAGLKTVFVCINSDAVYEKRIEAMWANDRNLSSGFDYEENINAAYVQLSSEWSPRFSSEIGLRLENTNVESQFTSNESDSLFTQNYTHIFPTMMVQYHLSENHLFSITYGRRIVRPNYRDMNPFVEVRDQYLYEKGNTGLKPELIDNIEFLWLLKKQYTFNLFYSFRNNPIAKSYLAEGDRTLVMPLNLSENHSVGLRIGLNNLRPFQWWIMYINTSLTYRQFDWVMAGDGYKNKLITPMAHITNQIFLPFGWKMEATGYYNGYMAEGQAKIHPIWSVSLGIRKNLFADKWSLYLYANDIFLSNRPYIELQSHTMTGWYEDRYDSRMIGVTLSYRFNWGKETKNSQTEKKIEESKRITF